jgi:hypothetical protein
MKKIFKIFLVTSLVAGVFNFAEAQRSRNNSGSGNRGNGGNGYSQHEDRGSRGNAMQPRMDRGNSGQRNIEQRNVERRTPQNNQVFGNAAPQRNPGNIRSSSPQRNIVSNQSYSRPYSVPRDNDRNIRRDDDRYSRVNNRYYDNDRYNNYSYRNGYNRRTVFMYGPRYTVIPRNSISVYFGGNPYYYNDGYFYDYYGGYYQPVFPPFGIRVRMLPFGYTRFYIGVNPFFYYNGIYYRQYDNNNYEVVDAPIGATVSSLPKGAKSVVVNGEKLYELNGTYYKEDRDSKGNDVYTVVGKNGEINNTLEGDNGSVSAPPASLQIGDIVNQLPEGSRVVTINGEKVYATPDNTYLKEESVDGGVVQYKVVGK